MTLKEVIDLWPVALVIVLLVIVSFLGLLFIVGVTETVSGGGNHLQEDYSDAQNHINEGVANLKNVTPGGT